MRIAQVSDFHFTHITWNPFRLFSKRLLGNLNWVFFRNKTHKEALAEALPPLLDELQVDLVLLGGDLTTTSLLEEFAKAYVFRQKIKQPCIAVPGNHDHYTKRAFKKKHFFRYFTNPPSEGNLQDIGVEWHEIMPNWSLIALDTTIATHPYSSGGVFSASLENELKKALAAIPKNHAIIVLNHFPFFQNETARRNLVRGPALSQLLQEDGRIRLYLHGHTHRQTIANLQESNFPIVLDSGSCTDKDAGSWNLIDIHSDKCTVTAYRWKGCWQAHSTEDFSWKRPGLETA